MIKYSMVLFGVLLSLTANPANAQSQQLPPSASHEAERTELAASRVITFEGAEDRACPTGSGMYTLLGSRALLTLPQIPPVSKEKAVPTDLDSILLGRTIIFRSSTLPDNSGKRFEYIGQACTVEITIRYRANAILNPGPR
jgi:hypothetical protein